MSKRRGSVSARNTISVVGKTTFYDAAKFLDNLLDKYSTQPSTKPSAIVKSNKPRGAASRKAGAKSAAQKLNHRYRKAAANACSKC